MCLAHAQTKRAFLTMASGSARPPRGEDADGRGAERDEVLQADAEP